jgi:hypothetical protein
MISTIMITNKFTSKSSVYFNIAIFSIEYSVL